MTHASLSHGGMHEIDPAAEYCRTELTQPLPERPSESSQASRDLANKRSLTLTVGNSRDVYAVAQGELDFQQVKPPAKFVCESYMRSVGVGEEAQPSCFGTPEVLNAQSRAENCCDDCGFVNGCYAKANR